MLPNPKQGILQKRANQFKKNLTPAEKRMQDILIELDIPFKCQSPRFARNTFRIFDFYIPYVQIDIEVDGDYHDPHKDRWKDYFLTKARPSMRVLRFKNEYVFTFPNQVKKEIWEAIQKSPRYERFKKRRNGAYGFDTRKTDPQPTVKNPAMS